MLRSDCSGQTLFPELLWFSAWHLYSTVYNPHPQITLFIPNTQKRLCTSQCVSADPHIPEVLTSRNNSLNTPVSYFPNGPARFAPTFIIDAHKRIELYAQSTYTNGYSLPPPNISQQSNEITEFPWVYWSWEGKCHLELALQIPLWSSSPVESLILCI